jgi:hypothetical protein
VPATRVQRAQRPHALIVIAGFFSSSSPIVRQTPRATLGERSRRPERFVFDARARAWCAAAHPGGLPETTLFSLLEHSMY